MFSIWPNISNNGLCNNFKQCLLFPTQTSDNQMWYYCNSVSYKAQQSYLLEFCAQSVSCAFLCCVCRWGVAQVTLPSTRLQLFQTHLTVGVGPTAAVMAARAPACTGVSSAVQESSLSDTQKYQEDEEPSSTQPQRTPSKEEGVSGVMIASLSVWIYLFYFQLPTATVFLELNYLFWCHWCISN